MSGTTRTTILPLLLTLAVAGADGSGGRAAGEEATMENPKTETRIIFDFGPEAEPWPSIDDVVMGGVSSSAMTLVEGAAVFRGDLSLENNGGFASVRSQPADPGLGEHHGILLKVRGDGRTYGFRLRTSAAFDGVSYQTPLETERDRWIEVRLPFAAFEPVFRGRRVPGHPALDPAEIKTFGVIIADKNPGPFRLEIDWIKAYRDLG